MVGFFFMLGKGVFLGLFLTPSHYSFDFLERVSSLLALFGAVLLVAAVAYGAIWYLSGKFSTRERQVVLIEPKWHGGGELRPTGQLDRWMAWTAEVAKAVKADPEFELAIKEEARRNRQLGYVRKRVRSVRNRLQEEIRNLNRRGNVSLVIGLSTTLLAVMLLAYVSFTAALSERRQLFLPVGDNYSCRSRPGL